MNDIKKSIKQQEFAELFLEALKKYKRVSGILATGFGKSRLVMLILEQIYQQYDTIYIVVNSTKLRDYNWKQDFIKWNKQHIWAKVVMVTYQTVYKWIDINDKPFIVYDECDFAIGTPEYGKTFYTFDKIPSIALTGYCALSKREELNELFPIIVEYSFEQAVEDKVINDVEFVFVKFDLSTDKTIKVEWTDKTTKQRKSFMQSENDAYEYADKQFRVAWGAYEKAESDLVLGSITEKKYKEIDSKMKRARAARIALLYNSDTSVKYALKVKNWLLDKSLDNKVITFSMYTKQADKLSNFAYHNNSTDLKQSEMYYDEFNKGTIRELAVCGKLYRGVNIVGLNSIILESYNSSDTIIAQVRGRGARLQVHDICTFYIMLPYFYRGEVQAKTQAVTWAENMLKNIDTSTVKIWDYRKVKSDL